MSSISAVGAPAYQPAAAAAARAQAPAASDPDHDGDVDTPGRPDADGHVNVKA